MNHILNRDTALHASLTHYDKISELLVKLISINNKITAVIMLLIICTSLALERTPTVIAIVTASCVIFALCMIIIKHRNIRERTLQNVIFALSKMYDKFRLVEFVHIIFRMLLLTFILFVLIEKKIIPASTFVLFLVMLPMQMMMNLLIGKELINIYRQCKGWVCVCWYPTQLITFSDTQSTFTTLVKTSNVDCSICLANVNMTYKFNFCECNINYCDDCIHKLVTVETCSVCKAKSACNAHVITRSQLINSHVECLIKCITKVMT